MLKNSTENIQLRDATIEDWKDLLDWRNDPVTRAASRNTDPVDEESHLQWLQASLTNPSRRLLIGEFESKSVGVVRIDFGNPSEVSWTVAPWARGKGIGAQMVSEALMNIAVPLIAVSRLDNPASIKVAQAAGFSPAHDDGVWVTLQRPAQLIN